MQKHGQPNRKQTYSFSCAWLLQPAVLASPAEQNTSFLLLLTNEQEGMMLEWEKGQEELSPFMSTLDTICTQDVPLGLMSHITSAVCSHEMSHLLKLTRKPTLSLAPLSNIYLCPTPKYLQWWKKKKKRVFSIIIVFCFIFNICGLSFSLCKSCDTLTDLNCDRHAVYLFIYIMWHTGNAPSEPQYF